MRQWSGPARIGAPGLTIRSSGRTPNSYNLDLKQPELPGNQEHASAYDAAQSAGPDLAARRESTRLGLAGARLDQSSGPATLLTTRERASVGVRSKPVVTMSAFDLTLPGSLAAALVISLGVPLYLVLLARLPLLVGRNALQFTAAIMLAVALWAAAVLAIPAAQPTSGGEILLGAMAM